MKNLKHSSTFFITLACISGLVACTQSPSSNIVKSMQAEEAIKDLTKLSQSLAWNNQCEQDYQRVITQSNQAQKTLQKWVASASANSSQLNAYVEQRVLPKLVQLNEESTAIIQRCKSASYDAKGVSMERPDMLREMMNEWRGSIEMLTQNLSNVPSLELKATPATLTKTQVNRTTPAGTRFKDCQEDFCLSLVVIPKGTFTMGGNAKEHDVQKVSAQSIPWELPAHSVTVEKPFAMSQYETTVKQFQLFQKETGWDVQGCRNWEVRDEQFNMYYRQDLNPSNVGFTQTENDPVLCVRKEDAETFAQWLSKKTGQTYRLPNEAEFEYAMRAGTTSPFYWGDDLQRTNACKYANVLDPNTVEAIPQVKNWSAFACNDSYAYTSPVGKFLPNKFDLYDMAGNAREWVSDCWHENYVGAPNTAKFWGAENNGQCNFPVLRGGAWIYNVPNVRAAYRNAYLSSQARSNMWGFRLVRELN